MSASDAVGLRWLFWSETEFFKEFASHITEPLKDAHTVNIQDETVFVFGVSFQFGNRTIRAKGLIVFRREKGSGKSHLFLGKYALREAVGKSDVGAVSSPIQQIFKVGEISGNISLVFLQISVRLVAQFPHLEPGDIIRQF